eukprot:1976006-Rhodomonas_salina.1
MYFGNFGTSSKVRAVYFFLRTMIYANAVCVGRTPQMRALGTAHGNRVRVRVRVYRMESPGVLTCEGVACSLCTRLRAG